jgi:LysR family transcriptional regulator of gallate degradation
MRTQIGLRQARSVLAVAEFGCLTRAARSLTRSQTSVTKTIRELERQLGIELFERSSRGVQLTAYGDTLLPHLREAAAAFKRGEQLMSPRSLSAGVSRFFCMDVSDHWIDAFTAVAERGSLCTAAHQLEVTPAAVSTSVRKLEDFLHLSLFVRTVTGLVPTEPGRGLLEHVKLARNHLQNACDEVLSMQGVRRGRVRVGTLPFAQTMILPQAILRLLQSHPQLDISTTEGPYRDLVASLKCGDIDFFVGAMRGESVDPALREERLLDDHLSVIVRKGHPLARLAHIGWPDLLRYEWILPTRGTPSREVLAQAMQRLGLAPPAHFIESSSFPMLRCVLLESDRITVASRHQICYEETHGLLTALPFDLHETRRSIGITRRVHGTPSPAVELLIQKIKEVAGELEPLLASRKPCEAPVDLVFNLRKRALVDRLDGWRSSEMMCVQAIAGGSRQRRRH